ncbi:hypothetical protein KIH86_04120 [Paenibacillus sp. HN-1]|uniref:hypothetical protein n=1 Tax=Paenibacillus TaxID=44249 RepID=UPI001CA99F94|nr:MULTISPECIES: hypothetical protein [Paenibacillus]MBY9079432.1 hypothetical protein [Paenibacillus sp. CGMCC 1.18879]MBY9083413.1 hypothetical protein [Paenibacillus sinensis]
MSWLYIVAVIIFAIISNANKAGKRKKGNTRQGGMPSFGSGPDENSRRPNGNAGQEQPREARGSGFPQPSESSSPYREERSAEDSREASAPAFPEPALYPSPDYDTGEGMSMEQPEEDGVEVRQERMRRELQRVHKELDRISSMAGGGTGPKSDVDVPSSSIPSHSAVSPADLRQGLIWAEILGPPRSRKPLNTRR